MKNLFKKRFLTSIFLPMGLLLIANSLQAVEDLNFQEEYIPGWQPAQTLKIADIDRPPFYKENHNINNTVLRLEGIDDDDNGLGEKTVPVGNGLLILVTFSMLYIIYHLRKRLFSMKFLRNKRVYFLFFFLIAIQTYSSAANYYWVEGSGNWSNINHWATTSGGTVKYTFPPIASDDVFFDANSGFSSSNKTVTLDANSFCHNMSWLGATNNPIFTGASGGRTLEIWGSLYLSPGMTVPLIFPYMKSTQPGETITTNGVTIGYITFDGAGSWKLMDTFTATGRITFTSGNLDFNGNPVTCYSFSSGSSGTRTLNIAGSVITCGIEGWTYSATGSNVLTNTQTANSLIILNDGSFTAKTGDKYNNVEIYSKANTCQVYAGTFNKVSFLSGFGSISSTASVITDSLIVSAPGGQFTFAKPTTVNKYLLMAPSTSCGSIIDILSGTINMTGSAEVHVNNVRLKSIIITGSGTPYTALSSFDLGGNTGWNIQSTTGNTYYWVGGTGNWSDQNHWANASGGLAGSGCIPTPLDNVIFDNNSGFTSGAKTVTVNSGVAYCNDMTWLGTINPPTFTYASSTNPLEVHGSLYLQRGMNFNAYSTTMYTEVPNQHITTNGATINLPINFKSDSNTGGWDFQDSIKATSNMNFYSGNLNFNGQYASITGNFYSLGFASPYNPNRTLNIANSTIDAGYWYYTSGIPLDQAHSVNSLIRLSNATMSGKEGDYYYNLELKYPSGSSNITHGIYNRITFTPAATTGSFSGTIITDSLEFKNSGNYSFATNITVNKYLATKISCGGITTLASTNTTEHTITMGNPSEVHVSNLQINYLSIAGPGVPYPASNSIKGPGIDAGWDFGAINSNTFYWVGGTGNWSDQSHWANMSGGTPGSGCIPSPFDNVIFDNNSFTAPSQTVTVNGPAYCDSMSWIGNATLKPIFMISNTSLQVNGSLLYQRGMTTSSAGTAGITMNSKRTGESITSHGVKMSYNLTFDGSGGWLLRDSLAYVNIIYFNYGNLDFNGQAAAMNYFYSNSANVPARVLNIANSVVTVGNTWNANGSTLSMTADKTANSVISIISGSSGYFYAKATDVYNVLEFPTPNTTGAANVTLGIFKRISIAKLNGGTFNTIITDTLSLGPGGTTNTFQSNSTSVVNKLLLPNGTPCLPTTIQSTTAGTRANLSMPKTAAGVLPDTVLLEFIRLRDMNAVAGADRAKLKKGPQSIDNGGYGLSGNNNNWTIVPYIGASGFDGLGPDIAIGCQDYPYTIELAPAYYTGVDGSYEWRKDSPTGTIISTTPQLSVNTVGTYYLTVNYDLSKACNLTDSKVVYNNADTLIWTGLAGNSDWNNATNWKKPNGVSDVTTVPRACTDVLIPAGTATYPILNMANTSRSFYPDAECRNIHFASGAEVAYTDSLHYSKAFVDLTLQRDKWYMLSAPLKNMYSGDYWTAPWGATVANGAIYNRNNPRIYMQQYQMQNPETGYYPGAASWSKAFNTLDISLGIGQGFVVGIDQPGASQTLHFPRPETKFEYFNKTSGLPSGSWSPVLSRSNSFRMFIEPGFTGTIPVSCDSISRKTLILGNPFMAHLSFSKLLAANPGILGSSYYVWTGTSFDAFSVAGNQSTKTDWSSLSIDQIAPMQSFIVEKLDPASQINNVNMNSSMVVTAPRSILRSNSNRPFEAVNIEVYRNNVRQSGATLISNDERNVATLFSGTVKEPAVIYLGSKDNPYSIFSTDLEKEVEIGIRSSVKGPLTIKTQGMENISSGSNILLEDRLLGISQDMQENPDYTFDNQTGNIEGRFFLKSFNAQTGTSKLSNDSGISMYCKDNTVYVNSEEVAIERIEVFDMQGQLVHQQDELNQNHYSFKVDVKKQLLLIKVTAGKYTQTGKICIQ